MKENFDYYLVVCFIVLMFGLFGYWVYSEWVECNAIGGTLVRGLIGFECIE